MVSDIYRKWFVPKAKESHYLFVGKLGMIIILALSVAVVFNVLIITDVAIFMLSLSAAELPANWAQWWWWRFNGPARVAASFGGAAIFCLVVVGPKILTHFGVAWGERLTIEWYWQTLLVMALTTVLWTTVALLTKPDPEKLLRAFYLRAHPLGAWAPFKHLDNPATDGSFRPVFRGIFIACLGASSVSLFILGLTHAWFARYQSGLITVIVSVVAFVVFWKMAQKYLAFLALRADDNTVVEPAQQTAETHTNL
jgi:Na+/proline symporter